MTEIEKQKKKKSTFREYVEALLTAVVIALLIRGFVFEAFKIPSGSMIPTLVVGDHLFVNKLSYGIRIPFTKKWISHFRNPERGETIVFIYPKDPSLDFIKRVVGVPGDKIRIEGDDIFVNGEKVQTEAVRVVDADPESSHLKIEHLESTSEGLPDSQNFTEVPKYPRWRDYEFFLERLGEHTHLKQENPFAVMQTREIQVPEGKLFVMGDNRDNSRDSREWGFVPIENVKGKAMFIWLSLKYNARGKFEGIRWDRFGHSIP